MDDRVQVGEIISKVFIKPVYQSLLDDIQACGYGAGNPERIFVPFPTIGENPTRKPPLSSPTTSTRRSSMGSPTRSRS